MIESLDEKEKVRIQKLISNETYERIFTELQERPKSIYCLINYAQYKLTH